MIFKNSIITDDCLLALKRIPSNTVNCCITSPPYYGLRDYGAEGQIGLESSLEDYLKNIVMIFEEVRRVLRIDGTLWLNLGDSYAGSGKGGNARSFQNNHSHQGITGNVPTGLKPKDVMGIPWRVAFSLQTAGWYLRQDIIWEKPNPMPESVKDRCTKAHEYIFLFSKSRKYYFDYNENVEPCVGFDKTPPRGSIGTKTENQGRRKGNAKTFRGGAYINSNAFNNSANIVRDSTGNKENITGLKNRRSVWRISTSNAARKIKHFATFPEELVRRCLLPGCPANGIVIDPFAGSGTVGVVAKANGRDYILIDVNEEYSRIQRERIDNS